MRVIQKDKMYKKTDESTKSSIDKGIKKLEARLSEYQKKNIRIENIYNDDILIHDIINKNFYVYKCAVRRIQLRILYKVEGNDLIIISHYCKKKPTKDWIAYFEGVSSLYEKEAHMA